MTNMKKQASDARAARLTAAKRMIADHSAPAPIPPTERMPLRRKATRLVMPKEPVAKVVIA